jgi:hypothetical protein
MQRETSNAVVRELERQVAAVRSGDLGRGEDMLVAQAHSLDELFSNLARRGFVNINTGYVGAGDTYLRLAFKAQIPVSLNLGGTCRNQESTRCGVRSSGQHRTWATAGEQRGGR